MIVYFINTNYIKLILDNSIMCIIIKNNIAILIYDVEYFQIKNLFLLDTKKNIIMNGKFTKIIYSDELITINGIFLNITFASNYYNESYDSYKNISQYNHANTSCELLDSNFVDTNKIHLNKNNDTEININNRLLSNNKYKKIYNLQTKNIINDNIIKKLITIEQQILDYYKQLFQCDKEVDYVLKNQLIEGNIKLYKDYYSDFINYSKKKKNSLVVILKISGIWETEYKYGLTYKFIEFHDQNK